jgi:hypothetical protein
MIKFLHFRSLLLLSLFFSLGKTLHAQNIIASEGFNNSMSLFTATGTFTYASGNSGASDGPVTSPVAVEGTHSLSAASINGADNAVVLTSSNINTQNYTAGSVAMSFRLMANSVGVTSNGMRSNTTADLGLYEYVRVEIAPDGVNYTAYLRVTGSGSSNGAYWAYTATGVATNTYGSIGTTSQPAGIGLRTVDGMSTVSITGIPSNLTALKIRITLFLDNSSFPKRWLMDDFKVTGTSTLACTSPPTLLTTAVTSISSTAASSGGQTINPGTGGGCAVNTRGVVWGISTGPTISLSTKTSNGTGISDFASSLTGLNPETQYFVRSYATNSNGTGYGAERSFWTLSSEPTAQPSGFSGSSSPTSCNAALLTFPALNTITNAKGYLILQRTGSVATVGTPTDGTGYSVSGSIGDGTVAAIVTNLTATSVTISNLISNSQYSFSIIPFGYNGSNAETYNYLTTGTILTTTVSLCKAYYVNDDAYVAGSDIFTTAIGLDANDGLTPGAPKRTVTNLMTTYNLGGGDVVFIDKGNYTESFTVGGNDEGASLASYLKFVGAGRTNTLFTTSTATFNVYINRRDFVWLEGISFTNQTTADSVQNIFKEYGNSSVFKDCKLDIVSSSSNRAWNIYIKSNMNTDLTSEFVKINNNLITNNNPNGIGIFTLGDVDDSRYESNTVTMTGSQGRGLFFKYMQNNDETGRNGGVGWYWPMYDTIVKNIITCNGNGIEIYSDASYEIANYLIESNSIKVNTNSNTNQSCIWLRNVGDFSLTPGDIKISKNRLIGGYAGIFNEEGVQAVKATNNYICSKYGIYTSQYYNPSLQSYAYWVYHNSIYTDLSCLYFDNGGQIDFQIANNILYTKATSGMTTEACISVNKIYETAVSSTVRQFNFTNGNLFYAPNGAAIGRVYINKAPENNLVYSTLSSWQAVAADMCSAAAFTSNDPNSIAGIAPNFENKDNNCDLDLMPTDLTTGPWTGGYPNSGNSLKNPTSYGLPSGFTLGHSTGLVTSDIKDVFSRSNWTIGAFDAASLGLLPVNLLAFNARLNSQRVILDWQTASEQNADYFNVEKSKDGQSGWIFVSRVESRGNSNVRADYQAIDHRPYGGVSYYRLKQVDQDGRIAYSQTRKINNESKTITLYPNPATDHAIIEGLDKNRSNMIHLLDVTGKLLSERFVKESQYRFDLTQLPPGVYHVVVNGSEHFQLVKTK